MKSIVDYRLLMQANVNDLQQQVQSLMASDWQWQPFGPAQIAASDTGQTTILRFVQTMVKYEDPQ